MSSHSRRDRIPWASVAMWVLVIAYAIFFSAASSWEIAIKARLGRLSFRTEPESFIPEQLARNAIVVLPVYLSHALRIYSLPGHHRDPFDRLLIAQSQLEDMPLLTADPRTHRLRRAQCGGPRRWRLPFACTRC